MELLTGIAVAVLVYGVYVDDESVVFGGLSALIVLGMLR